MATTDQLRKAEQRGASHRLCLNDFSRDRYVKELEAAGYSGVRGLSKMELFKRILVAGIVVRSEWQS